MSPATPVTVILFGSTRISAAHVSRRGAAYHVEGYQSAELPGDRAWDHGVAQAMVALRWDSKPARIVVGVEDDLLLYRVMDLPACDEATLASMVPPQAEAVLPQVESLRWAWGRLGGGEKDGLQRVLLCAVRAEALRCILQAVKPIGIPEMVLPSGLALAQVAARWSGRSTGPTALLRFEAHDSSLSLLHDGRVATYTTLDRGAEDWNLDSESGMAGCAWQLGELFQQAAATVAQDRPPQRLRMIGSARSQSVGPALAASLRLPVDPLDFADHLVSTADTPVEDAATFAAAAMPCLDAIQPIVRLPAEETPNQMAMKDANTERRFSPARLAAAVAWVAAVLLGLYALDKTEAARLENAVEELRTANREGGGLDMQLRIGKHLEQAPTPPLFLLEELSSMTPPSIIFQQFDVDAQGQVRVIAHTRNVGDVDGFIKKLSESPLFKGVALRTAAFNPQIKQWNFEVTATAAPLHRYMAHAAQKPPEKPDAPTMPAPQAPPPAVTAATETPR